MNKDDLMCFGTMMIIIVVGLSTLGYNWYQNEYGEDKDDEKVEVRDYIDMNRVGWGDYVTVEYTARFADTGEVFDTTHESVGRDASIPKAGDAFRDGPYGPKMIYVGPSPVPGSPNNDIYITWPTTAQGMVEGLVGMRRGETRTIEVPPERGFSNFVHETMGIYHVFPTVEEMTKSDFSNRYGVEPGMNMLLQDPEWKWNVQIISITDTHVMIMNDPEIGEGYSHRDHSWNSTVVSKNATGLMLRHAVSPGEQITYRGFEGTVLWMDSTGLRIRYDTRNDPRAGRDLIYEVRVTKILRKVA